MLVRLAPPTALLISVADMKKRLREDSDDSDDLIEALIRAATARAERRTGRVLVPTEFEWRAPGWASAFGIPAVPFREVVEFVYLDAAHVEHMLPSTAWRTLSDDRGVWITLNEPFVPPALSDRDAPIRIKLNAGFNDTTDQDRDRAFDPDPIDVQMVAMLVAHWFRTPEAATADTMTDVPAGFEALAAERRIYR